MKQSILLLTAIISVLSGSACRAGAQDTAAVRTSGQGILVDFQDVDLRAVITALAEAGSLNVSYGEIPATRVTLRLHQAIAKTDVLPLLRSLATSNGLQVIEEERLIRLQPDPARNGANPRAPQPNATQEPETRLFVYRLKHVRAAKLATTLQSIFGAAGSPAKTGSISSPTLSQQLTKNQVPPVAAESAKSATVVQAGGPASLPGTLHGIVQIVPDENTNALVIHAQAPDYEVVRQAIEALDLRPLQVLIEVLIAEVRHSSELDLGVAARSTREPTDHASSGPIVSSSSTADLILRMSRSATFDIDVAIRALQAQGDVRILSRPVLLAQNNQEAKILVGSQRPFVQVFRSLATDAGLRDQVVQYKDVGTSLTILPTINADGYVNLQLAQEVSTATNEVQFGAPVISTREASTHLFVRDGQTAVVGGLVDRAQERSRSGFPVLSLIPLVGYAFGSTTDSKTNTELYLFLTPHIIQTDEDADSLRNAVEQRSPQVRDQLPKNPPLPAKPPTQ